MKPIKLIEETWSYTLYQTSDQDYVLSVLCGGSALYEVQVQLSHTEAQRFLTAPEERQKWVDQIREHSAR